MAQQDVTKIKEIPPSNQSQDPPFLNNVKQMNPDLLFLQLLKVTFALLRTQGSSADRAPRAFACLLFSLSYPPVPSASVLGRDQ